MTSAGSSAAAAVVRWSLSAAVPARTAARTRASARAPQSWSLSTVAATVPAVVRCLLPLPASSAMRLFPKAPLAISSLRWHGGPSSPADAPTVPINYFLPNSTEDGGERVTVPARVGESLMKIAHRHHIPIEGACEGVCACSTCHVILSENLYDSLAESPETEASEDEEDMLDMAPGLTPTSRLGCQVFVTEGMAEIEVEVPAMTRNFYVDGHVPEPH